MIDMSIGHGELGGTGLLLRGAVIRRRLTAAGSAGVFGGLLRSLDSAVARVP